MADKEMNEENMVVVMTDDQGNEYYYEEEMIIPVGDEKYALLIGLHNEDGEEEYIEPTDEEFEAVQKAYDALCDEAEQD